MTTSGDIGKVYVAVDDAYHASNFVRILRPRSGFDAGYLALVLQERNARDAMRRNSGISTIPNLQGSFYRERLIPSVPLSVQQRTVSSAEGQIQAVQAILDATVMTGALLEGLAGALVRRAAARSSSDRRPIGEVAELMRSQSVTSNGPITVRTATSGCLTPSGFDEHGASVGRMTVEAAAAATIQAGEVLVSRSNTEPLVGRAAHFPGSVGPVVASDLIFRLRTDRSRLLPEFAGLQLSALQLSGYWRDRSSGASSTMKKITGRQLLAVPIPIPSIAEQGRVVSILQAQLDGAKRAKQANHDRHVAAVSARASVLTQCRLAALASVAPVPPSDSPEALELW